MSVETSAQYGAYHIANNTVEYNPQRKSNFTLIVTGLTDLPRVGAIDGSTDAADIITNGQEQLVLSLRTCSPPETSLGKITNNRGNSQIKFAGKPTFSDISFEAYDYIGSDVKDTLLAWQNQSYNSKYDYIGKAATYKKSCQLLQLSPNGDLVRYWDIKGAWLSNVKAGDFTVDSDDTQTVSATMVIDWAEMHLPDDYTA